MRSCLPAVKVFHWSSPLRKIMWPPRLQNGGDATKFRKIQSKILGKFHDSSMDTHAMSIEIPNSMNIRNDHGFGSNSHRNFDENSTECPWKFHGNVRDFYGFGSVGASEITQTLRSSGFPQLCIIHQDQAASKTFTRPCVTCGP